MLIYRKGSEPSCALSADALIEMEPGESVSFNLASGGHWFGHGFNHTQHFPLGDACIVAPSFGVNNIQSPIWMCSAGVAILAETTRLLDVRFNENRDGCLKVSSPFAALRLRIWKRADLPEAQRELLRHLGWPNQPPEAGLFGDSLFCTWTQYPRTITQQRVLEMAFQIRERGYPCATLLIDDRWESCFGDLSFSEDFPDPKAMIEELHRLGFRVWLWVTPFVNRESRHFEELSQNKVLVPRRDHGGAAMFSWWGGEAGLIDATAPHGRAWLRERLRTLREDFGVDGFKIDGGDFKYQPAPDISLWHDPAGESGYSDALLSVFDELLPLACESRTAWLSQRRSIIWREGGKDSHWGKDNGLQAMVSLALHLGLMGYDILIPDMIPGRVQTLSADHPLPSDELMVRWTEASVFMPLIQFSYFPWNYAEATERAVRAYALLHRELQNYIAAEARDRKSPLIRPIWYDSPDALELMGVCDEYMLGRDLLVAPVLEEGAVARDVFLPPGRWINAWSGMVVHEGHHISFPSPCPGIPLFVRAERPDLVGLLRQFLSGIKRGSVPAGFTSATYTAGLNRDIRFTG